MTFAIAAHCRATGAFGAAAATSAVAVYRTDPRLGAALVVASEPSFPDVDLRVDNHEAPVATLRRTWEAFAPDLELFPIRALGPDRLPE